MIPEERDKTRSDPGERAQSVFERDRQIRSSVLSMPHTFYLCTLNQFVGNNGHAWPSQRTIAEAMNAGLSSVKKWQAELEALGIITVDSGVGCMAQNHYRIDFGRLTPKTKAADASNSLPHRPFDAERSMSETINGLPRRPGMVSDVATKDHKKDHKKDHSAQADEFQELVETWNTTWETTIRSTDKRKTAFAARFRDTHFRDHWRQAIERARRSPFCCGHGQRGWVADIDWFLRPDTVTRIMEGKYDGEITDTGNSAEQRERNNAAAINSALGRSSLGHRSGNCLALHDEANAQTHLN